MLTVFKSKALIYGFSYDPAIWKISTFTKKWQSGRCPNTASGWAYISLLILMSLNRCISVKSSWLTPNLRILWISVSSFQTTSSPSFAQSVVHDAKEPRKKNYFWRRRGLLKCTVLLTLKISFMILYDGFVSILDKMRTATCTVLSKIIQVKTVLFIVNSVELFSLLSPCSTPDWGTQNEQSQILTMLASWQPMLCPQQNNRAAGLTMHSLWD